MGSSPTRPTCSTPSGHIEQLPSRSWRAKVYAGTDPLTGREIRFRKTCKTERAAQIELGKLLAMAQAGRQPDSDATVAQLLDQYVSTAGWDVSTRVSNLGYIRRTIDPALGSMQVRRVRGPLLDTLYAQLMRCGKPRRLKQTCPDEAAAALGWLLSQANGDRFPTRGATLGQALGKYLEVADLEVSAREAHEGYVRRIIRPVPGEVKDPQARRGLARHALHGLAW